MKPSKPSKAGDGANGNPSQSIDSWLARQLTAGAGLGRQTFEGACGPCHGLSGEGLIGPPLQGNATLADPKKLLPLLQHGKNAMPPVGRGWDRHEITALAAYVKKRFGGG